MSADKYPSIFPHQMEAIVYLSNRPQVSMVYRLINHFTWDVGRTLEEFVNHEPQASDLRILRVFFQHPAWFISL